MKPPGRDSQPLPRHSRRQALLTLLALPAAGCTIQPLAPLHTERVPEPSQPPTVRAPALGQSWTYRKINAFNSELLATEQHTIAAIAPEVVVRHRSDRSDAVHKERQQPWGQVVRELGWDEPQTYEQALTLWPADLSAGTTSLRHTYYRVDGSSARYWIQAQTVVPGWERVVLPRGAHLTLRVERLLRLAHPEFSRIQTIRRDTLWLAPELGRWVARECRGEYLEPDDKGLYRGLEAHHRWELVDWI